MALSSLPDELFPMIADFCSVHDETLLNFSVITRHCYQEIYMKHPNLFYIRINRLQKLIFDEFHQQNMLTPSKYKRVRSEETKPTSAVNRQYHYNNLFYSMKKKKEFIDAQQTVKSKLFEKWDNFLDEYNNVNNMKQVLYEEIFSNVMILSAERVVVADFVSDYYVEGKIGNEEFGFEGFDKQDPETRNWTITLAYNCLAIYSRDECYLYENVATNFLEKHKNLKISHFDLIEILLQLQPWFFDQTFARFKNEAIIENMEFLNPNF